MNEDRLVRGTGLMGTKVNYNGSSTSTHTETLSTTVDKPMGEVDRELSTLSRELDQLEERTGFLMNRLSPVLDLQERPEKEVNEKDVGNCTDLGRSIRVKIDKIRLISKAIAQMTDRLQI